MSFPEGLGTSQFTNVLFTPTKGKGIVRDSLASSLGFTGDEDELSVADDSAQKAISLFTTYKAVEMGIDLTAAGSFAVLPDVQEMPEFGTPPNIKKVNKYAQKQSSSLGVQADAPDLDFKITYDPIRWRRSALGKYVGRNVEMLFAVVYLRTEVEASRMALNDVTTGVDTPVNVDNSIQYFVGRFESALYKPGLTDEDMVSVSLSVQSDFVGPVTISAMSP